MSVILLDADQLTRLRMVAGRQAVRMDDLTAMGLCDGHGLTVRGRNVLTHRLVRDGRVVQVASRTRISFAMLHHRYGFTRSLASRLLPPPMHAMNPHRPSTSMSLWFEDEAADAACSEPGRSLLRRAQADSRKRSLAVKRTRAERERIRRTALARLSIEVPASLRRTVIREHAEEFERQAMTMGVSTGTPPSMAGEPTVRAWMVDDLLAYHTSGVDEALWERDPQYREMVKRIVENRCVDA